MIVIKNLSKEYISNNKTSHLALNDVSFTLPSRGMVFIIGKSGSGKSTLLNILGGLDSPTIGKIVVDGNDFDKFHVRDFDNYRNTYLGFIFQDFHLLDNLNVQQNVTLALDLQGKKNKKALKEVLKQVDLEGFEKRYPNELSGGQQQRVAIARAIIKKPRLVLADEPTGNLDSKTSKQVLNALKEISKNTLVIIVSHNKDDANNYADRIIELSDGKIIHDVQRKAQYEFSLIEDKTINFPHNVRLSNEELRKINDEVKKGGYQISQKNDMFTETNRFYEKGKYVKLKPGHIKPNKTIYLANKYTKGQYLNSIFTSLIIGFMVIMIALCQVFSTFNSSGLIKSILQDSDQTAFVLQKGYYEGNIYPKLNTTHVVPIDDEDIQQYYNHGYEGNVYKLYNHTLPFSNQSCESPAEWMETVEFTDFTNLYINIGRGVLECDLDFLNKKYGVDGEVKVLAGSLNDDFKPYGVIITDYLADAMIYHTPSLRLLPKEVAYNKIVNASNIANRGSYKAIISTNYMERYKKIVDVFLLKYSYEEKNDFKAELDKLKKSDEFAEFINELNQYLSIGYSIHKDGFYDSLMTMQTYSISDICFTNAEYLDEKGEKIKINDALCTLCSGHVTVVNDGEMAISHDYYNRLFGTSISQDDPSEFVERELTIKSYYCHDEYKEDVVYEKTFKITEIYYQVGGYFVISNNDFAYMAQANVVPYALYFDNFDSITSIYDGSSNSNNPFYSTNELVKTVVKIQDIVIVFNDLFFIIVLALGFVSLGLLTSFIKRSIESKKYEIGILRAIGGKNRYLYLIFLYQIILIVGLIFIVSNIGMMSLDDFINNIIIINISRFLLTDAIEGLVLIEYRPIMLAIINGIILILSLISSISILLKLRNIKPINIIKEKE